MKLIIPSKGLIDRQRSYAFVKDTPFDVNIVTHTDEDRNRFIRHLGIAASKVHVNHIEHGITAMVQIRDWVVENLTGREWYISLDDNITAWHKVDAEFYDEERIDV